MFPFYSWSIFHTHPEKAIHTHAIGIHQIDDTVFENIRLDKNFLRENFSHINVYYFYRKLDNFHMSQGNDQALLERINRELIKGKRKVVWGHYFIEIDPIEYQTKGSTISRELIGTYEVSE